MDLSFADASFQDLCSSRDDLVHAYGTALAKTLCCRLAVLTAAPALDCVPITLPIGLMQIDDRGRFAVAVGVTHCLIFDAVVQETAAMIEPSRISKLRIIGLESNPTAKAGR